MATERLFNKPPETGTVVEFRPIHVKRPGFDVRDVSVVRVFKEAKCSARESDDTSASVVESDENNFPVLVVPGIPTRGQFLTEVASPPKERSLLILRYRGLSKRF